METIAEKLAFFKELVHTVSRVRFTELNDHYEFTSEDEDNRVFALFFAIDTSPDRMKELTAHNVSSIVLPNAPVIYTNSVGMAWISDIAAFEDQSVRIEIMGPVFLDDYSAKAVGKGVDHLQLSVQQRHLFMDVINKLPVVPLSRFYEYGIMLHYCIYNTQVTALDFTHADAKDVIPEIEQKEKHGKYLAEQKVLGLVEEGNLRYRSAMEEYILAGRDMKYSEKGALQQARNEEIVFTSLVLRAAIRGGLSPETAYEIGEGYMSAIERAENIATIKETESDMLEDFVRRVHRIRAGADGLSPQIRDSCDYISLHIHENIGIHTLAERLGYADYYFSTRFRKETGKTVRDYVMEKKIEVAKEELASTNRTVQDIAFGLGFGGQSHFSAVFRSVTGMSPAEYRRSGQQGGSNSAQPGGTDSQ